MARTLIEMARTLADTPELAKGSEIEIDPRTADERYRGIFQPSLAWIRRHPFQYGLGVTLLLIKISWIKTCDRFRGKP